MVAKTSVFQHHMDLDAHAGLLQILSLDLTAQSQVSFIFNNDSVCVLLYFTFRFQ